MGAVQFPSSHASLSSDGHPQYALDMSGTAAARPAPGRKGRIYHATDTDTISRDNGTSWTVLYSPALPTGIKAFKNDMASSAALTATLQAVPGYAVTLTLEAGRMYEATAYIAIVDDESGTTGTFNGALDLTVRSAAGATVATTSTSRGFARVPLSGNGSGNASSGLVTGYLNNLAAGEHTIGLFGTIVAPSTGWRVLQAAGDGYLMVEDIGAAV